MAKTKTEVKVARAASVTTLQGIQTVLARHTSEIAALDAAICPRVAARLTALERDIKLQQEENWAVFHRLNADDKDKKQVFEGLTDIRGAVLGRVQAVEQDISAINKSLAILHSSIQPKDAQPTGSGECSAPSKATDRGIVSYLITQIKNEMGLEFTEQGMKRIIELVEKA